MKKILLFILSIVSVCLLVCGCGDINVVENDNTYDWTYTPNSSVVLDEGMVIDGKLSEDRWNNKKEYLLSDDGVSISVTTSFSQNGLYIGAVAKDSNIKWTRRMDMYSNSCFWFSVKAEDIIYEVATSTFNIYVDQKNCWNFNSAYCVGKGDVSTANTLSVEFFVPWDQINIDVTNGLPSLVRINPHYRYYDNTGTTHWLQGMFAFDDRDRNETSLRFGADGYKNVDSEGAVVGNAVTGQAKSDGWDLTEISNGVVKSDVDHSQGIFFTDVCSSCYWYTVTTDVGENIYNKPPQAVGVMDALNQIECTTLYVEPQSAIDQLPTTIKTLSFWNNNSYAWNLKQEGKVTPDYTKYNGKIVYTVVKDNGYFYYFINGQYVLTKYVSYLQEKSCPGFYTLDAQGIFTNYEAHDLSNDESQVDTILESYGVCRIKVEGDTVGGSISFSETIVEKGDNVTVTILPANRNILTSFLINGVDCYDDVKDKIVDGEYTIKNIQGTTTVVPVFSRLDSTVEVSGALKDTLGNNCADMSVSLKGSSSLLFYSLTSGGSGTYKFYVPAQGNYTVGGKTITVDGNYTLYISGSGYLPQTHTIEVTSKITNLDFTIELPQRDIESYGVIEIEEDTYISADNLQSNQSDFKFFDSQNHTQALLTAKVSIPKNVVMPSLYGIGFIFTDGTKITTEKSSNKGVTPGSYYTREIGLTDDGVFTGSLMGDLFRHPGDWGANTWTEMQYNSSGDSVWLNKTEVTFSLALYNGYFYLWIDDSFILKVNSDGIKSGDVHYMYEGLNVDNGLRFGIYFYQTQDIDIKVKVTESYDANAISAIHASDIYECDVFPQDYIAKVNEARGEDAQKYMIKTKDNKYTNLKLSYDKWTIKNPGYYYLEGSASNTAILSARIDFSYLDDNFKAGFTICNSSNLTNKAESTQFFVCKKGLASGSEHNESDLGKGREMDGTFITSKKLYVDLTLVLYNDIIYIYVDGVLIEGEFTGPYTMPVSITNGNLKYNTPYASGASFRFGLATTCAWGCIATFSNVSLKTGNDALTELQNNYIYNVTWVDYNDTELLKQTLLKGQTPVYTGTPSRANDENYKYTFTGWTPEVVPVTSNVTYKATYSESVGLYTVIWQNADGTIIETDENLTYGTTPSFDSENPSNFRNGDMYYSNFTGWSPAVTTVTGDVTYTAVFGNISQISNNVSVVDGKYRTGTTGWASSNYAYTSYKNGELSYSTTAVYSVKITSKTAFSGISGSEGIASIIFSAGETMPQDTIYNRDITDKSMFACSIGFRATTYTSLALGRTVVSQSSQGGTETFGAVYGSCPILNAGSSATLTVVYYKNYLYAYIDGKYITNISLIDSRLSATTTGGRSYSFTENAPLTFGINAFNSTTMFDFEVLTQKYGDDAISEINNTELYSSTVSSTVMLNFKKNGDIYSNTPVTYHGYSDSGIGYYYIPGEASNVAVLSSRITLPSLDANACIGFTITSSSDLSDVSKSIQFYVNATKVYSAICGDNSLTKGREYTPASAIFTTEKLYCDLTLILYNDTIYLYIDGVLCTGNFSSCYTMPVAISNPNLNADVNNVYASDTEFRFGLVTARCWPFIVTFSDVLLKTGSDATQYITENYSTILN